jgi:type IV pilus modification protein PilV
MRGRVRQRGFGLIEVLVAMAVLAFGLLGIAGGFLQCLRDTRSALWHTQAVFLVSDMVDRIRANAAGLSAYELASYGGAPGDHACVAEPPSAGSACSSVELAEDDLARWLGMVGELLPLPGAGTPPADVQYIAAEPARYRIAVAWRGPGDSQVLTYSSEIQIWSGK